MNRSRKMSSQQIKAGLQAYVTPILICIVGWLLNDKISSVDRRIERLETTQESVIEVRQRVSDLERRVGNIENNNNLERVPAKHEDIYSLNEPK